MNSELRQAQKEGRQNSEYLSEIISCVTTGDSEVDNANIKLISESMHELTGQDKETIVKSIELLRTEYFTQLANGKTEEEAMYIVETKVYKMGLTATKLAAVGSRSVSAAASMSGSIAGGALCSPVAWAFAGLVFTAQTATDHKKVKDGKMTNDQFKQNMKINAVSSGSGLVGSSGGALAGFAIGSAILPGVGTVIGTFAGAIGGGIMGAKLGKKLLEKIEDTVEKTNEQREQIRSKFDFDQFVSTFKRTTLMCTSRELVETEPDLAKVISGTLKIQALSAKLTRDTSSKFGQMMSFGLKKMDPYARFSHAGKQWSSDYINNGGKEPDWSKCNKYVWDLELALPPNEYQDNFYFSVMDSDMKRNDDTVGFGEVPLATLINYDQRRKSINDKEQWLEIFFEFKSAGKIKVRSSWHPRN